MHPCCQLSEAAASLSWAPWCSGAGSLACIEAFSCTASSWHSSGHGHCTKLCLQVDKMQGLDCLVTALTCMCRWMGRGRLWERRRCPLPSCTAGICSRSVDAWHQASKQWQKKAVRVQAFKPQTLVFAGHQAGAAAAASLCEPAVRS